MTKLRSSLSPIRSQQLNAPDVAASRPGYMPQLDALRAFAVMAVMFQNFYGSHVGIDLPIGEWGVQLFFVLSGFLITGILLNSRDRIKNFAGEERKFQLRQFYIRRALRILPLFYLVVLSAALVNIRPIRENLFWHLTYTTNIMLAIKGGWVGPASHLWSLAVEEQFYLLWPWLILWVPTRYLRPTILLVIAAAPVYKIIGYCAGVGEIPLYVLTIACLDALGIGALLALYSQQNPQRFNSLTRDKNYIWFGFVLFLLASISCFFWQAHYFVQIVGSFVVSLLFAWIIHRAAVGFTGATGRLLIWKPLLYLGQISYGLYIFHKFMSIIVPRAFEFLELPYPEELIAQALLLIAINIAVASCSWFLFERPINDLKKRFEYDKN